MIKVKQPLYLIYGISGFIVFTLYFFIVTYFDKNPLYDLKVIEFFLFLFFILAPVFHLRRKNFYISFLEAFKTGFFSLIIISVCTSIFIYIFVSQNNEIFVGYINENLNYLEINRETLVSEYGAETYNTTVKNVENTTPLDIALDFLIKKGLISIVILTVVSILFRRKKIEVIPD